MWKSRKFSLKSGLELMTTRMMIHPVPSIILTWNNFCRPLILTLSPKLPKNPCYTLSEAWSVVNWAYLMAAQSSFGTDFYDRSILRPKHRAYYRSGRPLMKIGPKGALGSHEIRPIHYATSLGQSIDQYMFEVHLEIYAGTKHPQEWFPRGLGVQMRTVSQ